MLRMALPKDAIIRIGHQQLWECLAAIGTVLTSQAGQLGLTHFHQFGTETTVKSMRHQGLSQALFPTDYDFGQSDVTSLSLSLSVCTKGNRSCED